MIFDLKIFALLAFKIIAIFKIIRFENTLTKFVATKIELK